VDEGQGQALGSGGVVEEVTTSDVGTSRSLSKKSRCLPKLKKKRRGQKTEASSISDCPLTEVEPHPVPGGGTGRAEIRKKKYGGTKDLANVRGGRSQFGDLLSLETRPAQQWFSQASASGFVRGGLWGARVRSSIRRNGGIAVNDAQSGTGR